MQAHVLAYRNDSLVLRLFPLQYVIVCSEGEGLGDPVTWDYIR